MKKGAFDNYFKKLLIELDLSESELSRLSGVSQQVISNYSSGKTDLVKMSLENSYLIVEAINFKVLKGARYFSLNSFHEGCMSKYLFKRGYDQ